MEDDLAAGHGFLQRCRITQIAGCGFGFQSFDILQVAGWANQQAKVGALVR
jgi:hypothetical protein